jgi:hypothetical protein
LSIVAPKIALSQSRPKTFETRRNRGNGGRKRLKQFQSYCVPLIMLPPRRAILKPSTQHSRPIHVPVRRRRICSAALKDHLVFPFSVWISVRFEFRLISIFEYIYSVTALGDRGPEVVEPSPRSIQKFSIRDHPHEIRGKFFCSSSTAFPPCFKGFRIQTRNALSARRCFSHRHHDQPRSVRHEKQNCRKEIFAHRYMMKHAPQHASDDQQVDHNVNG